MRLLALDLATKCGWVHSSGPGGTWDFSIKSQLQEGERLLAFRRRLDGFDLPIDLVVYESVRSMKNASAIRVLHHLEAILISWCSEKRMPYRGYAPTQIKKHASGNGNASKDVLLIESLRRWPSVSFADNNHIDACWLCDLALLDHALTGFQPHSGDLQ